MAHFKTNYKYRLSNHCSINELILVTYALISNAVENEVRIPHVYWHRIARTFSVGLWDKYHHLTLVEKQEAGVLVLVLLIKTINVN